MMRVQAADASVQSSGCAFYGTVHRLHRSRQHDVATGEVHCGVLDAHMGGTHAESVGRPNGTVASPCI
eukprot:5886303-Prymnesium_polylepis.1